MEDLQNNKEEVKNPNLGTFESATYLASSCTLPELKISS
jgi:hypothetical protein